MKQQIRKLLSQQQIEALLQFKAANGRKWKAKLMTEWEFSRAGQVLQTVRNTIGNKGLYGLKL